MGKEVICCASRVWGFMSDEEGGVSVLSAKVVV